MKISLICKQMINEYLPPRCMQLVYFSVFLSPLGLLLNEPHSKKTCLRGLQPALTQARLHRHRGSKVWILEVEGFVVLIYVGKTKALISCAVISDAPLF